LNKIHSQVSAQTQRAAYKAKCASTH